MARTMIFTATIIFLVFCTMIEPIISFTCPEDDIADGCKTAKSCLYPDPSDSNGFLQCDDSGQVYHQKCNPSLVWNDKIKNCDAPRRRPSARKTTEPAFAHDEERPVSRDKKRPMNRIKKPTIEEFL